MPLPLHGLFWDRCACGKRFAGSDRRAAYELHWRRVHEPEFVHGDKRGALVQREVEREEAERIYAAVHGGRKAHG